MGLKASKNPAVLKSCRIFISRIENAPAYAADGVFLPRGQRTSTKGLEEGKRRCIIVVLEKAEQQSGALGWGGLRESAVAPRPELVHACLMEEIGNGCGRSPLRRVGTGISLRMIGFRCGQKEEAVLVRAASFLPFTGARFRIFMPGMSYSVIGRD